MKTILKNTKFKCPWCNHLMFTSIKEIMPRDIIGEDTLYSHDRLKHGDDIYCKNCSYTPPSIGYLLVEN